MNRRNFLRMAGSGLLVAAAPAIVRSESLMPVKPSVPGYSIGPAKYWDMKLDDVDYFGPATYWVMGSDLWVLHDGVVTVQWRKEPDYFRDVFKPTNIRPEILRHELGHAIGLSSDQTRPDLQGMLRPRTPHR